MRKIKFRAWDKEYEKMTYFDDVDYQYTPPLVFRLDQVFKKDCNYDDYEDFEYNDVTDIVEVMQYTGLHDKNGKEIYEGDIVKVRRYSSFETEVVKFDKGCFYAGMHYGSSTRTTLKLIQPKMTEVIGNIYENKELLNETNR